MPHCLFLCSAPMRDWCVLFYRPPATLTNGRCLSPRDTPAANGRRGNSEPVQTGLVLIFHSINYKNIRLHLYIRHFPQRPIGARLSSLREKSPSKRWYFCEFFRAAASSNMAKSKVRCFILSFSATPCVCFARSRGWTSGLCLILVHQANVITASKRYSNGGRMRKAAQAAPQSSKTSIRIFICVPSLARLNTATCSRLKVRHDDSFTSCAATDSALCTTSSSVFSPWLVVCRGNVDSLHATTNFRDMQRMCDHHMPIRFHNLLLKLTNGERLTCNPNKFKHNLHNI